MALSRKSEIVRQPFSPEFACKKSFSPKKTESEKLKKRIKIHSVQFKAV